MNNQRARAALALLCCCFSVNFAFADACSDLYRLPEAAFTTQVQQSAKAAGSIYGTLNQCVANNACSSSNDATTCMQNLYYYDAMAAFYYQQTLSSSSLHASTPQDTNVVTTPPAPNNPAPVQPQPTIDNTNMQPIIVAPPSNN